MEPRIPPWLVDHTRRFVICIQNEGYPASLEKRKLYEVGPDDEAKKHAQLRVRDESGKDYLYPAASFVEVELSREAALALLADA